MNIQEIHDFINFIKDQEINGYSSPKEIDSALDRASLSLFAEKVPVYALNQRAQDDLAPFKKQYFFTPSTTPFGVITLPTGYLHMLSIWALSYNNDTQSTELKEIDISNDDEVAERYRSQLNPVTTDSPIAQWIGKGMLRLYPGKPSTGEIWYLQRPARPFLALDQTGRTFTYNPTASVQMDWDEINLNKVMFMALANLGINMSNEQMVQYSELRKQDA